MQYASPSAVWHSASPEQPRHSVVFGSQIGAVGTVQSFTELAHPPHAPPGVQTSVPPQAPGSAEQASHASVAPLQIGFCPAQPAFDAGSHSAHAPFTHSCLPSVLAAQSVASRHSAQCGAGVAPTQNGAPLFSEQATPLPGAHSHRRSAQAVLPEDGHAMPQPSHSASDVLRQVAPPAPGQQSSSEPHPACVFRSHAGSAASARPASFPASPPAS